MLGIYHNEITAYKPTSLHRKLHGLLSEREGRVRPAAKPIVCRFPTSPKRGWSPASGGWVSGYNTRPNRPNKPLMLEEKEEEG